MNTAQDKDHIQSMAFHINFKNIIWWIVVLPDCAHNWWSCQGGWGQQRLGMVTFKDWISPDFFRFLHISFDSFSSTTATDLCCSRECRYILIPTTFFLFHKILQELAIFSMQCVIWIIINFLPGKWFQYFSHFAGCPISKRSSQTYKSAYPCPFW